MIDCIFLNDLADIFSLKALPLHALQHLLVGLDVQVSFDVLLNLTLRRQAL